MPFSVTRSTTRRERGSRAVVLAFRSVRADTLRSPAGGGSSFFEPGRACGIAQDLPSGPRPRDARDQTEGKRGRSQSPGPCFRPDTRAIQGSRCVLPPRHRRPLNRRGRATHRYRATGTAQLMKQRHQFPRFDVFEQARHAVQHGRDLEVATAGVPRLRVASRVCAGNFARHDRASGSLSFRLARRAARWSGPPRTRWRR
jgi:hypothetical protein